MKKILLSLIFLGIASPCFAKARYAQKKDMIREAECIVIVNITKVEETNTKGRTWTYRQKVTAVVEECLKGDAKGDITIYGLEGFICAQCRYDKGRFILFLRKDDTLWVGSNWHLGIRPIKEKTVEWLKDDKTFHEMQDSPLDKVIDEINTVVEEQRKEDSEGVSSEIKVIQGFPLT